MDSTGDTGSGGDSFNGVGQWSVVSIAASIGVDRSITKNDQSSPQAFVVLAKIASCVRNRSEDNWVGGSTCGIDLSTLGYDKGWSRVSSSNICFDGGACFNRKSRTWFNKNIILKDVNIRCRPCGVGTNVGSDIYVCCTKIKESEKG